MKGKGEVDDCVGWGYMCTLDRVSMTLSYYCLLLLMLSKVGTRVIVIIFSISVLLHKY